MRWKKYNILKKVRETLDFFYHMTINEHFNNEFDKMHKNDLAG